MDRKFRAMSLYIGMMFFAVILLILVTSFSNTDLNPSYDIEKEQSEYQVTFNRTMEESVNSLTESNEKLNEQVKKLTAEIDEKNNRLSKYQSDDVNNLLGAVNLYLSENTDGAREKFSLVNKENLEGEYIELYNKLEINLK